MDDAKKVIKELSKAIKESPEDKDLYRQRADLYFGTGEFEKALVDFTTVIELDPKDSFSYYDRGRLYDELQNFQKAIADFDKAIKLDQQNALAYYGRGRCKHILGRYKDAIAAFDRAIEIDPEYSIAYQGRGNAYHELGETEKAMKDFEMSAKCMLSKKDNKPRFTKFAKSWIAGMKEPTAEQQIPNEVYLPQKVSVPPESPGQLRVTIPAIVFPGERTDETSWCIGDRALARWSDLYWYPATILNTPSTLPESNTIKPGSDFYHVLYDDGVPMMLPTVALLPLEVKKGDEIQIRPKELAELQYFKARVADVNGEILDVNFDDGPKEKNTKITRARFWRCPIKYDALPFAESDRVLSWELDGYYYPADIVHINGDRIIVQLLNGRELMMTAELLFPFNLKIGDQVESRWQGGRDYLPCRILEIVGERVLLSFPNHPKQWSTIRLLRVPMQP